MPTGRSVRVRSLYQIGLVVGGFFAACGDSATEPSSLFDGTWVLVTFSGQALPATYPFALDRILVADTFWLESVSHGVGAAVHAEMFHQPGDTQPIPLRRTGNTFATSAGIRMDFNPPCNDPEICWPPLQSEAVLWGTRDGELLLVGREGDEPYRVYRRR